MDQENLYTLLAREMAGELSKEEATALQQLLLQDPNAAHIREVFAQNWKSAKNSYSHAQVEQLLEKHQLRLQQAIEVREPVPATTAPRKIWKLYAGIAASILVLVTMGMYFFHSKPTKAPVPLAQLVTSKRTRSQIILPDGSRVWLNAGSKLNYPEHFEPHKPREVTLEGEAFFVVTGDAERPFHVHTKTFHVHVLGTSFNVRAYPTEDSAVTSLVQGAVEVVMNNDSRQVVALRPNEKLTVPVNAAMQQTTSAAPTPVPQKSKLALVQDSIFTETAWVQNKLAFKHLKLEKVAAMLEQWYGIEIDFRDDNKRNFYFTGVFERESLEQVLNALENTRSFTWEKDSTGKIWIK
ncbi:ferric-dicitrate binding protein FerR (iron transport regulator) [Chitinophaga dinghuensis]|uniref:Ferric-dicitrate binding protein FerR (Iron transport regulator) n=1 Tax=Chitinophaga dinghuensis TaxID=1539050 RepID=A0A327WDZ9_9BACT|nr:FecR domain-containing protein [Chitinophaga dinghuensis]RAJ87590.1 ferric-dicitrate binding protein FerR (iron transport regulator) [Chitinophaga dinghuensis]